MDRIERLTASYNRLLSKGLITQEQFDALIGELNV